MKLYLMRHGEYVVQDMRQKNPLTEAGKKDIATMAQFLKEANLSISQIFHSEKLRAKETAEIIAHGFLGSFKIEEKKGLSPLDDIDQLISEISEWKDNTHLLSGNFIR